MRPKIGALFRPIGNKEELTMKIPNLAVKMTQEEHDLFEIIKWLMPYEYDGMKVLRRYGDLRKAKRILKSLMDKDIVKYDGFDPDNYCTKNLIRKDINWSIAILNWNKENQQ